MAPDEDLGDLHGHHCHGSLDVCEDRCLAGIQLSGADPQRVHDPGQLLVAASLLSLHLLGASQIVSGGLFEDLLAGSLHAFAPTTLPPDSASAIFGIGDDRFQGGVDQTRVEPETTNERAGAQVGRDTSRARLLRRLAAQYDAAVLS